MTHHSAAAAADAVTALLQQQDLAGTASMLGALAPQDIAAILDQVPPHPRAVAFRLLTKPLALEVFEALDSSAQRELVAELGDDEVAAVFDELDPDDRVELLDELPATVAKRLIRDLPPAEREVTAVVLGYPRGSVGRRMSPDYVHVLPGDTLAQAVGKVQAGGAQSETIYTVPVIDHSRTLVGVVSLRSLLLPDPTDLVSDHLAAPIFAYADEDAETAARRCVDRGVLAIPIVDTERRLLGMLTVDDAARIVAAARDEDAARAGGVEPLRRPYLQTPVRAIARSRVIWLLVLGVSAILTVNVLELFEATLQQKVALALFVPLLTGIGGNTGAQAATTVTRALAVGETRPRDAGRVAAKEAQTGLLLGVLLGAVGWLIAGLIYGGGIGAVIGLTLLCVCTMAATVGGTVPLLAKAGRMDPAVFSTPFITTFCDATGLIIYFSIAKAILGI